MSYSQINTSIIKNKVGLLNLARDLGNISKACKLFGPSRDTFYRYEKAHASGGIEGLLNRPRNKENLKNRIDPVIESRVLDLCLANPAWGQTRLSNELRKGKRSKTAVLV